MSKSNIFFVVIRILIGLFFLGTGLEKLLSHYQNFLYVIQSYDCFSPLLEELAARTIPWLEFFIGLFLVMGLWIRWAMRGLILLLSGFIMVVGQALIRGLPIDECGCFGDFITLPPQVVIIMDSCLLVLVFYLISKLDRVSCLSLDNFYKRFS